MFDRELANTAFRVRRFSSNRVSDVGRGAVGGGLEKGGGEEVSGVEVEGPGCLVNEVWSAGGCEGVRRRSVGGELGRDSFSDSYSDSVSDASPSTITSESILDRIIKVIEKWRSV